MGSSPIRVASHFISNNRCDLIKLLYDYAGVAELADARDLKSRG